MRGRIWVAMLAAVSAIALAQGPGAGGPPPDGGPPPGGPGGPGGPRRGGPGGPPPNGPAPSRGPDGGPASRGPREAGPQGRWWTDPRQVERLGLTADQQKRIDAEFQQRRLKLIDLTAAVEKQEAILDPLLAVEQPDEKKVLAQIDKVAQARAELEKENAAMLLGFRRVLTAEQWKKLQAEEPRGPGRN